MSEVNRILGTDLQADDIPSLLDSIGFATVINGDDLEVSLPSWRPDATSEVDVIEEIARHYGYENIGRSVPKPAGHGHLSQVQIRRRRLREVLIGLGISEAMPNPIVAPDTMERAGISGNTLRILNPLVADESALRLSLRPGLLTALAHNEHHRRSGVSLFEIGNVYPPTGDGLPNEHEVLGVVLAGRDAHSAVEVWREISTALGVGAMIDQSTAPDGMHATRSGVLRAGRDVIGGIGEIAPEVLEQFGVSERVAVLEVRIDGILSSSRGSGSYRPISRMPSSDLDLAFVMRDEIAADRLERALRQAAAALLVDVNLFDTYRGNGVPEGQRSLAWRLRLQAQDRNLTDADIADVKSACEAAATKLGAELRS